ncbi:MAG: hypothetical protein IRZ11_03555 [Clostridia bacterium]|nr:hypothetical protein [Clostridia bacterium]
MTRGARLASAVLILALAAWFLGAALWLERARGPFRLALAGRDGAWSLVAAAERRAGADLSLEIAVARAPRLPPAFVWELALPGQGVTCRGSVALGPTPPRTIVLSPCEGRWSGSAGELARHSGAAWFAVTWWDGSRLRETRFSLRPAGPAAPPPSATR